MRVATGEAAASRRDEAERTVRKRNRRKIVERPERKLARRLGFEVEGEEVELAVFAVFVFVVKAFPKTEPGEVAGRAEGRVFRLDLRKVGEREVNRFAVER